MEHIGITEYDLGSPSYLGSLQFGRIAVEGVEFLEVKWVGAKYFPQVT
jgi:hypothetical protein